MAVYNLSNVSLFFRKINHYLLRSSLFLDFFSSYLIRPTHILIQLEYDFRVEKGTGKLSPGVKPYIGEGDVIMNRDTAHFAVNHPQAQSVLRWVEKTQHPQQTFYATLNYNPQFKIKGSYKGDSISI